MKSIQETYGPKSICFGCGPANEKGLRIRTFEKDNEYICDWDSEDHHESFPGMMSGGIVGTLLDCHSNWAAAHFLMAKFEKPEIDCTVTASYNVKLLRPTPSDTTLHMRAWITESSEDRATVEAELIANGKVCATCEGLFVAVKEGHPAYHRWESLN